MLKANGCMISRRAQEHYKNLTKVREQINVYGYLKDCAIFDKFEKV